MTLPEAEQDVLAALYDAGEATAAEVRMALAKRRPLTHSSVQTLLVRLEARELVTKRKADKGKAFVFRATRHKARAFAPAVANLLRRAFSNRPVDVVAALFETRPPNAQELVELQTLVDTLKKKR